MSIRRPDDDDLDRLLAGAEWPELKQPETAAAVDRLRRAWQELRRVEPARRSYARWHVWGVAGAAAATVAMVIASFMWRNPPRPEPIAEVKQADVASAVPQPVEHAPTKQLPERVESASPNPAEQLVREPSIYERMVLRTRARAAQAETEPMIAAYLAEREIADTGEARGASREEVALDRLLANHTTSAVAQFLHLVAEPKSQQAALAALGRAKHPPIDSIAAFLDDPRRPVRLAAAHALSTLDDARAVERLSQSVGGIGRQEALMALLASRSQRASELIDAARRDVYLMASVRAAEQQLLTLQTENGENLQ